MWDIGFGIIFTAIWIWLDTQPDTMLKKLLEIQTTVNQLNPCWCWVKVAWPISFSKLKQCKPEMLWALLFGMRAWEAWQSSWNLLKRSWNKVQVFSIFREHSLRNTIGIALKSSKKHQLQKFLHLEINNEPQTLKQRYAALRFASLIAPHVRNVHMHMDVCQENYFVIPL